MQNIPNVKLGIVAVSRDCFPIALSETRRANIVKACGQKSLDIYEAKTTVENEKDMQKALEEVKNEGVNALVVFLETSALRPRKHSLRSTLTARACLLLLQRATAI